MTPFFNRESIASENSTAYFPLISELVRGDLAHLDKPNDLYNKVLDILSEKQLLPAPTALSLVEYGLSLHSTAPMLQAYYHYYNTSVVPRFLKHSIDNATPFNQNCINWADWYGHQACNIKELKEILGISNDKINDQLVFDRYIFHNQNKLVSILGFKYPFIPSIISYVGPFLYKT